MPSHFKYRIKKTSENKFSVWDYDSIPRDIVDSLKTSGLYDETDRNITPSTCAFIQKVRDKGGPRYLCAIKLLAKMSNLIASNTKIENPSPDGSREGRVSGAEDLVDSGDKKYWSDTHFKCKYIEERTGVAKKEGVGMEETTLFPMCNCYSPRGGLAITHFDGAVKRTEAPGYPNPGHLPNLYDTWRYSQGHPSPHFNAPVPSNVLESAHERYPYSPTKLGFIYLILNARATVVPCCWWAGKDPLIYKPEHFRVIDLAVAQEYTGWDGSTSPKYSLVHGVSNLAEYEFIQGDYFSPNEGDNYLRNILLGRNYDPTLPETGNNQRIIYALDVSVVGRLTKDPIEGDDCGDIPWHFDSAMWFNPRNCSHPDCKVKYQWGSMCNGGGAFDLANGKACPYYENPLIGPEDESEKLCTLNKMYAGDSITGGAILELMWMCKGGFPWTQEEWESLWKVPYIWSTIPFNPRKEWTDMARDKDGNLKKINTVVPHYHVYAVKTTIDLNTGKAKQAPPKLLPGGSITQFDRPPEGTLKPGEQIPYLPTAIQEIEMKPVGTMGIVWPVGDLSLLSLNIERGEDYAEKLQELRNKPYNQIIWSEEGKNILVMGYGMSGKYDNGVYCVNTAFLVGEWFSKKDQLLEQLSNFSILDPKTQKLLKDLWRSLLRNQVAGANKVLDGMEMQRAFLDDKGMFIFDSVPLNILFEENTILVFGFSSSSTIDVTFTKVKPIFNRAYLYQSSAKLMTGWKTTWNGRPSLFFNENDLINISGEDYSKVKGRTVEVKLEEGGSPPTSTITGTEGLSDLLKRANSLAEELKTINEAYSSAKDDETKSRYFGRIRDKSAALRRVQQLIQDKAYEAYAPLSSSVIEEDPETERAKIEFTIQSTEKEIIVIEKYREDSKSAGYETLFSFYTSLIKELRFDIEQLQGVMEVLYPEEEQGDEELDGESDAWEPWECSSIDYDSGEDDTDEGGGIEELDNEIQPEGGRVDRLYVPHLNPLRKNQKSISKYGTILPGGISQLAPKLEVLKDSGIAEWRYFDLGWKGNSGNMEPYWVYAPKGSKRVVVYSTRQLGTGGNSNGVKVGKELGTWYSLASCSSMIVMVLNPEVANRHNEFMIYSMSAEVEYRWKAADGNIETATRKIKFVPFNYTQVNKDFPGYTPGKIAEKVGIINKYGVVHDKISVSENVEITEKKEGNRHPWVIFAIACTEDSDVKPWSSYSGQWYPSGDITITTLPSKQDQIDLYMEYAFIGEVYDQDDRRFKSWSEGTEDGGDYKTRILFNHPRAGTIRSVFKIGEGDVGEKAETAEDEIADGFKAVPMGSSASTTLWPHARLSCRDYEIHYVWRDNHKNTQTTEQFFMGRGEPRQCGGPSKRYTYYTHGDHDLGTVFKPKITFGHWEGGWQDRTWNEEDIGYSWNTGRQTEEGDPTRDFPESCGESYGPKNNEGALYYPYTRAEPHSKFIPIHPVYIWDFLVHYRNKPKKSKYFGGFRMWASDICYIGPTEQRNSKWETHFEYNPKEPTVWMGRSRTRGPLFQLEYEDYQEKKPKVIFLRPFASRNTATRNVTWTYYASVRSTKDEEWDPDILEKAKVDTTPIADNPSNTTKGVWKAICRGLYSSWIAGDDSAYYDLEEQANWGAQYGWEVSYESGLIFPDEEEYVPPTPPDSNQAQRDYLNNSIQQYKDYVKHLEESIESTEDIDKKSEYESEKESMLATISKLEYELEELGSTELDGGEETNQEEVTNSVTEQNDGDVDLLTGCHKGTLEAVDQRGSFFFDNTYMPGSVSDSNWRSQMEEEAEQIKEQMKKTSQRFYWYEQKSFGTNLPWSPFDSPPLFGNTGREMYIIELCTIGSIISWLPTTNEDISPTKGKDSVPSWWTAREPEGDPAELVTLLPPEPECTRAIKTLSSEPQNPFYSYIFEDSPFDEKRPQYSDSYSASDIRIITKHDVDHYGESWYRSDVGRMTLTLTESNDPSTSKLTKIKVFGDSPATKDSTYMSVTTPAVIEGVSNSEKPNQGDQNYDNELPPNSMWGSSIKGLAVESGQTIFVGQRYPGYYSPYTHGKVFVGYKEAMGSANIHWAWPKDNRDSLTRGEYLVKIWTEIPDLESTDKSKPKTEVKAGYRLESVPRIKCAPYMQKHPAADDGREVNLGPDLKKDALEAGEREPRYKDETYYAIVMESEREQGGKTRPPLMWAQQIDNPGIANNPDYFKRPRGNAVAYRVLHDGSISAVTIGKEQNNETPFSTGFLVPKVIKNSSPGGNFITSDIMNSAGRYPAFEVGSVSYRYAAKVFTTKDYTSEQLKKFRVVKNKNAYGPDNHLVEVVMVIPNIGVDILFLEVIYEDFFFNGINNLFKSPSHGAAIWLTVEGEPVIGTDYSGDRFHKEFIKYFPLELGIDTKEDKVIYDLDLGLAKNLTLTFRWNIRCKEEDFDEGLWGGEEKKYNYETNEWDDIPENKKLLSDLVQQLTLGCMVAGKCVEVVKIEEAKFVVSTGERCKLEGGRNKASYNFYSGSKSEWYKCTWEENDEYLERTWDQENLFLDRTAKKGEKQSDEWAHSGYEKQVDSFREAGLNYNKFPKSTVFPNSCVEIPELPQSKLKMDAWEEQKGEDNEGRTWTWGGVWTTRVAGPEWRTADPLPSRDFIWWPAPPYHPGRLIFKGRAWFFGDQYKDESRVVKYGKDNKRGVEEDDDYNKDAYTNLLTGYDHLMRNIQDFEAYRSNVRKGQAMKSQSSQRKIQDRKAAASQASLNRMYSSATAGIPGAGTLGPPLFPPTSRYVVNTYKAFNFLDEVGLSPENASWDEVKQLEDDRQKSLYEDAINLAEENLDSNYIRATAIVPFYEWKAIIDLTGKEWYERNNDTDFVPITEEDLEELVDATCTFTWKNWDWEELQSFTFRDEHKYKYEPKVDISRSNPDGLLRRCGRKWYILGKAKKKQHVLSEARENLESSHTDITEAKGDLKDPEAISQVEDLLETIINTIDYLGAMKDHLLKDLGSRLMKNYSQHMGTGYGTFPRNYSRNRDQGLLELMQTTIDYIQCDSCGANPVTMGTDSWLTVLSDAIDDIGDSEIASKKVNKSLLESVESLTSSKDYLSGLIPSIQTVKQKMEYFNNVTEELQTYTRELIGQLGVTMRSTTSVDKIDCHGPFDDEKKGYCDARDEEYKQKWDWDPDRNTSVGWPPDVSEDGGGTLKRPDPWWRY